MLVGVVIGVIVALFQWGFDPINISIIATAIFATGQFIEGNFITPKLIGDKNWQHTSSLDNIWLVLFWYNSRCNRRCNCSTFNCYYWRISQTFCRTI